jgi:hypothetical protein
MRPAPQPSPLRVGALTGSEGAADLVPMATFGFFLGAAFQIQGDLLNLLGSEQEYGKEIEGDLSEGKRTLPLIHLLRTARGDDRQTVDYYLRLERSERTAARSCHTWSSGAPNSTPFSRDATLGNGRRVAERGLYPRCAVPAPFLTRSSLARRGPHAGVGAPVLRFSSSRWRRPRSGS